MQAMKLAFFIFFFALTAQAEPDAFSPEWLNLLHMKRSIFSNYSSDVLGEGFFLSSNGAQDPQAELQATIEAMFGGNSKQTQTAQCRFLARREYLLRTGPEKWKSQVQICQFSEEWLRKLNATKVTLVFASAYLNSAASSFGHTFLKLQNPENEAGKDLLNYGINFAARTEETRGALYALYGLTGFFPGAFSMTPYHQMIKDYTHLEGRDIWEYELDLQPEEVRRMLFHLLELDRNYFDYYFLDDNCSYAILKILEVARPGLKLTDEEEFFVIPLETVKLALPLVKDIHFRPSLETEWRQRKSHLPQDEIKKLLELNESQDLKELPTLSTEALTAAQYYVSLKGNQKKWQDLNYALSRERAKRSSDSEKFQIQRPSFSPDEGPHSSAVQMGFHQQSEKKSLLLGFHSAFHDQLSRNVGASPFSHLEVLGLQALATSGEQILLQKYRLLETLSTESISQFEKPLSWGILAGGEASPLEPTRMRNQVSGRLGYSYDFLPDRVRASGLAVLGLQQDLEQNFQFAPGLQTKAWILWTPEIRTLLQYEKLFFPSHTQVTWKAGQAVDVSRQLEVRWEWRQFEENEEMAVENSLSLYQNFLF